MNRDDNLDLELLFAAFSVRLGRVTHTHVEQAWLDTAPGDSIADTLIRSGVIDTQHRKEIEVAVGAHLDQHHGDRRAGLAAIQPLPFSRSMVDALDATQVPDDAAPLLTYQTVVVAAAGAEQQNTGPPPQFPGERATSFATFLKLTRPLTHHDQPPPAGLHDSGRSSVIIRSWHGNELECRDNLVFSGFVRAMPKHPLVTRKRRMSLWLTFTLVVIWCPLPVLAQSPRPSPLTTHPRNIVPEPTRVILAQSSSHTPGAASDRYAEARQRLVETRIRTAGVTDERVLAAIADTPRHEFVPLAVRDRAYFDMALPIGAAQTISSPFIVASMTETLDPQPTDRVLEIGTGSGYQAAVLSPLVAEVYSIEIVESLGLAARRVLDRLGYDNVFTKVGDGFLGWPEKAPFDKIIVTCSPESVPVPLLEQLREGGSMIIPVGERYQQTLYRMTKRDGELVREPLRPTLFVPMTGTAESGRKALPDPANPVLINGDFEQDTAVGGGADSAEFIAGWYYGRQVRRHVESDNAMARFENETPGLGSHLLQGIAIDGSRVSTIRLSTRVRTQDVVKGPDADSWPMLAISYYDAERRELGMVSLGPYRGSRDWRADSRVLRVPPTAREAIVRIGLFGATGRADFDNVKIEKMGR